jgi:hypothetical protein
LLILSVLGGHDDGASLGELNLLAIFHSTGLKSEKPLCLLGMLAPARGGSRARKTALLHLLNEVNLIAFEPQACQPAGGISASVDVDPVLPHLRIYDRGVAMDDDFFERLLVE